MQDSKKIIVNTLAQYVRTLINMVMSLYSSRLVLSYLGVDDFGIYMLIAGVVTMLSFLTNSLVRSTQRFLSVSQGHGNITRLKEIFSTSLILHILLGLIISIILVSLLPIVFNGFLNIPFERIDVAKSLYKLVILMVYISFVTSPYRALLISHENIVYISILDIVDGILKVVLVLLLPYINIDKLLLYGIILLGIQCFNFFACGIYSHIKYEECVYPNLRLFSIRYIKELSFFTGWVVYSSICITFRLQGLAILLNHFYGAVMNAAYGIGSQISGMLSFISASFANSVAPQLMAAEGANNRNKMFVLAEVQSKFSFLLLAMIGVPAMFEMRWLLEVWLVDVPEYALLFACMFITMQIIDMLSTGLDLANKAIGNIGSYSILTYTPKLITLPISFILLKLNTQMLSIAIVMVVVETICMLLRIYLFKNVKDFDIKKYFLNIVFKSLPPVFICVIVCSIVTSLIDSSYRIFITYFCAVPLFLISAYFISLNIQEKLFLKSILIKFFKC